MNANPVDPPAHAEPDAPRDTRTRSAAIYVFGALGGLLFGYDLGVVAGALLEITPEFHLSAFAKGWVTSSLLVGAMVGAVGAAWFADRLGRRMAVIVAGLVFVLGCLVASIGLTFAMLLAGRVVMGLAVGALSMTIPIYLSELAPARVRGALSGLNQLLISTGILVAYLVTTALDGPGQWHWAFGIAIVPALLLVIGIAWQPESPRWLVKKGREDQARAILSRRGEDADARITEIRALLPATGATLGTLLAEPRLRRVLVLGVGITFGQQIIGINTIVYYAPTILTTLGYGRSAALLTNVGLGALTVAVTVVMVLTVDRIGRRYPMILGAFAMALCMFALGTVFLTTRGAGHVGVLAGWVAVAALALFKASFSMSWGGMGWIIPGEIFPLRVREPAMSLATFANWLGNLLVGLFFPVLLAVGTGTVFYLFTALALIACGFVAWLLPETKGKSLERIEQELSRGAAAASRAGSGA